VRVAVKRTARTANTDTAAAPATQAVRNGGPFARPRQQPLPEAGAATKGRKPRDRFSQAVTSRQAISSALHSQPPLPGADDEEAVMAVEQQDPGEIDQRQDRAIRGVERPARDPRAGTQSRIASIVTPPRG